MTRVRLQFVQAFTDRHGRPRYYFRKRGCKRVPLPGLPGSEAFMAAYKAALGDEPIRNPIGANRSGPGTVAASVAGYLGSLRFAALAESSRQCRRRILERFRNEHGSKRIADLERRHVMSMLDAKAATPGEARNFLSALRVLMRYAIDVELRTDDPTAGVRMPKLRNASGFYAWTEEDICTFEAKHPVSSKARLAFALLLFTAQRRADVVRLGWQHVRDGMLHVRQRKTGRLLAIPIHPDLRAVLEATLADNLTFLVTEQGKPYHDDAFTHWFKKRCDEAGLPPRASAHGLRKAACRRLAEAGCSEKQIAAISGHLSLREVARYTEAADQAKLARQGIEAVTRTPIVKPAREV